MAVIAFDEMTGVNGHEESLGAFIKSHASNTDKILNKAEGKKLNAFRPAYDPDHPDNQWPLMVHHAAKGELTVGQSLVGVEDPRVRKQITNDNEAALAAAQKAGYRLEPFIKPQVAVLDPAAEKAALQKRNEELQGHINLQSDLLAKMEQRLAAIEQK